MASPPSTAGRPEARTESVEDLLAQILDGRIRIPVVQRGLGWKSGDVRDLFDSIYRGFPIGSLLLQQAPAEAAEVRVGPIPVMATERRDALWVVDGQQRLTSLAAALGRPEPVPAAPVDPFVIYFDAATETFQTPPEAGGIEPTWVPLPRLLDASRLEEWERTSSSRHQGDAALLARIREAGRRLREYRVPAYVIRILDEELLRTIFTRIHSSGKPLAWSELRDGLFVRTATPPASPSALADELTKLGMGRPGEAVLLPCLVAHQGLDVTRSFDEHLRTSPARLDGAAAAALPALRRALGFLRSECKIPHLHLLPYAALLAVLARFFQEHPEPNDRTRTLLTRWIWRTLVAPAHDDGALRRAGVAAITSDEEASVQALLALAPTARAEIAIPPVFDARDPGSRLALLGLASLRPLDLARDGRAIEVAELTREREIDVSRPLFSPSLPPSHEAARGPANRILLPGQDCAAPSVRTFIAERGPDDPALRSHAIDAIVAAAIVADDIPRALARRAELLASSLRALSGRMAAWGRSDSPSLEYLMKKASA